MTELEQLRADMATIQEAAEIAKIRGFHELAGNYDQVEGELKQKIAKLEAQQAPEDEWAEVKQFIDYSPDEGSNPMVKRYIRHLETKVAELDDELRCERIDGGKVRDDRKARIAEPVINDMRALKTAQQILATYKHLHDESTQKEINQAIGTLRQMAGTEAVAYKFDPTPDICPINQDDLREKLAELTTIANAIPPACGLARELVKRRIEGVKKEIQNNG